MPAEEAEALGKLGFVGGRAQLQYNAGVYIGPSLLGALQFGGIGLVVAFSIYRGEIHAREKAFAIAAVCAVVGFIGTIVARRHHRGVVELEMDEEGISEFEDGARRVKISWRDARARVKHRRVQRAGSTAVTDYWWVTIASPTGDMIEVTNADDGILWPLLPIRDVAHSGVDRLAEIASQLPPLEPKVPSSQRRAYTGPPVVRVLDALAKLATLWFFYSMYEPMLAHHQYSVPSMSTHDMATASVFLGVMGGIRLLAPILALRALRARSSIANGSAYRSAAPPTLETDAAYVRRERRRIVLRLVTRMATALLLVACPLMLAS